MPELAPATSDPTAPRLPPALVWEMDCGAHLCQRRFDFVAPGAVALLGHSIDLWRERPGFWRSLVHPEDAERARAELDAFDAGQPFQAEVRLLDAGGEYRWVFCQGAPRTGANGRPASYVGTCVDFSRDHADAQAAGAARDQLLSTLSHELRNPLNAILGWTHLLQSGELSPEQTANGLAALARSAQEQARLIGELLDGARTTTRSNTQLLDLEPIVDTVLANLRPELEAKDLRVHGAYALVDRVVGDPEKLSQLVTQLVANAIGVSPAGGTIEVEVGEARGSVEIRVTAAAPEPGPGEPGEASRSTGDGLELARTLAELHGGDLSAASAGADSGEAVTVRFPAAGGVAGEDDLAAEDEGPVAPPSPTSLSGVRVLVAEDDAASRDLILKILDAAGARVVAVSSAREALELVTRYLPHVLVSDIEMPEQDGYKLLRQVRAFPSSKGGATPAIALTAHAAEEDRDAALASGFDRHIGKPVTPARLVAVVAEMAAAGGGA